MRDGPPTALTDLLARLHLATPQEVRAVRGRARRLARDLPLFESVWVDALAQARLLTSYQAAEINAGRGERLVVGPYVLRRFVAAAVYAQVFEAAEIDTRRVAHVVIVRGVTQDAGVSASEILQAFGEQLKSIESATVCKLEAAGAEQDVVWAAYGPASGITAHQWLSYQGRFLPAAALEIARQMAAGLARLEKVGLVHGDVAASSLYLNESGTVQLTRAGVRCVLRPDEATGADRLGPETFDYMAPERLAVPGAAPATAGDVYACGLLWWHLLTGRAPRIGGNIQEKLIAVQRGNLLDVRRIAPDTSPALAQAIDRCAQPDPEQRPTSFTELVELLGPSTDSGRRLLAGVLLGSGRRTLPRPAAAARVQIGLQRAGSNLLAAAACALLLAAASWPLWRSQSSTPRQVSQTARPPEKLVNTAAEKMAAPTKQPHLASASRPAQEARQVNYQARDDNPSASAPPSAAASPVIELQSGKETLASTLRLVPGAVVRGMGSARPVIAVPPAGLLLAVEDLRFENVDFVWRQRPEVVTTPDRHAIVDMRCSRASFVGCTFQAAPLAGFEPPPAIRLNGRAEYTAALTPAGHVQLERCALAHVACGVDCRLAGPVAVDVRSTLHAGEGPLVRFVEARRPDAPAVITLNHVTVRGASSVVELAADDSLEGTAPITLTTVASVFAPREDGSLLVFSGQRRPRTLLKAIEWLGQDSLATPESAVAKWSGSIETALAEDELSIDGLVFSNVEFEGEAADDPAASRVRRWLAPGRLDENPGIPGDLPKLPSIQAAQIAQQPPQPDAATQK